MSGADIGVIRASRGQDLNLLAGQAYFGNQASRIRTLLGSCVAVTLWSPQRRLGGMCHFLLPTRPHASNGGRDARFGDEAIEILVDALLHAGTKPQEYEAHLYGGADTLPGQGGKSFNVGERNIEQGWGLIDRYGFSLQGVDVGDCVPRHVSLSLVDGQVDMRRGEPMKKSAPAAKPVLLKRTA